MAKSMQFIKKIVAVLIVFVMTIIQCLILGISTVSFAIDMLATNSNNVQFKAYFNVNSEETTSIGSNIDSNDLKLNIVVAVRNEGYFNGQISLENPGFKFEEDSKSSYIGKIENNTIYLKQINAGETINIAVGIKFLDETYFPASKLNQATKLILTGQYYNSKDNLEINGESEVTVDWKIPQNTKNMLGAKVLTNSTYLVDASNKKVVQILVGNKLENNAYPVKNTKIEMSIPDGAELKEVHKRTTNATNGDKEFTQSNYTIENGKLIITIDNNNSEGENISWQRNVSDMLVVTYEFPERVDLSGTNIKINSLITAYDNNQTTLSAEEQTLSLNQEVDGIITLSKREREPNIYKGKIYTGEERVYTSYTDVNIDYAKAVENIEIIENDAKFIKEIKNEETQEIESIEKDANIQYKTIKMKKSNITEILGQIWSITLKDQNNNQKQITNDTQEDENGDIIITLNDGTKIIYISTTKPVNNGMLSIETTKAILKTNYTRDEIKELTKIADSASVQYTKNDGNTQKYTYTYKIGLRETGSKVALNLSKVNFSTLSTNKNIELVAKLDTSGEDKNLYKDPSVEIVFPKEITGVKINQAKALYANGLEIKDNKLQKTEDGRIVIYIKLNGEQQTYDTNGGLEIHLYLDIDVDDLTPSKNAQIEMNYTNEKDGTQSKENEEIYLQSQYGLLLYNKLSNYNLNNDILKTSDGNETTVKIVKDSEEREMIEKTVLINNYNQKLTNINLIGRIPDKHNKNTFLAILKNVKFNNNNAKVYYSNKQEISTDDASWVETIDGATSYKVVLDELDAGEVFEIENKILLPKNLGYNQKGYLETELSYIYAGSLKNKSRSIILETDEAIMDPEDSEGQLVNILDGLTAKIVSSRAGVELKNGDSVYEGETIKYNITFTNNTGRDYTNIKLQAIQENGKIWNLVKRQLYNQHYQSFSEENFYEITESNEKDFGKIESLKNGQSINFSYEVATDLVDNDNEKVTYGTIKISSDNGEINSKIKTIENKIKNAELKLVLTQTDTIENYWLENGSISATLNISNLTEKVLNNVKAKILLSKELSCDEYDDYLDFTDYKDRVRIESKEKNANGETIVNVHIDSITANETMEFYLTPYAKQIENDPTNIKMIAKVVSISEKDYYSNEMEREVYKSNRDITMDAQMYRNGKKVSSSTEIKSEEEVELIITVVNNSNDGTKINISNGFPVGVDITKVTLIKGNNEIDKSQEVEENTVSVETNIDANETILLREKIKIDSDILLEKQFETEITVNDLITLKLYKTNIVIKSDKEIEEDNGENIDNKDNPDGKSPNQAEGDNKSDTEDNKKQNVEDSEGTYTLSGVAWIDSNKDGKRDENEKVQKGVKVIVIDAITGKTIDETANTNEEGRYSLTLQKGEYIIAFQYDTNKYGLTVYQAKDIVESLNSDVVIKNIEIDNKDVAVGVTDQLNIESDISNIDIGLIEKEAFDLKLEKYVSKVVITNKEGTKTTTFDKSISIPKVDIRGKYLSGSRVLIEYTLRVVNVGDTIAYVRSIKDTIPAGLAFESNLNSEWYKKDNGLYNENFSDEAIKPGESKEVKLVVTKTMTTSNTGLIKNSASIFDAEDEEMNDDNNKENDESSADLIISVSTGEKVGFVISILAISGLLGVSAYSLIQKWNLLKYEERRYK